MANRQTLKEIVRTYLDRSGLSAAELSRRVGKNDTLVKAILSGRTEHPRSDTIHRLALEMQMDPAVLLGSVAQPSLGGDPLRPFDTTSAGTTLAKDLPVYGAAEGGKGVMVLDNDPIEYIERPPELVGVKGAYGVYVVNDSMYPAYEPGDRALIHPGKPVVPGKDALFIRQDPDGTRYAMIKRLVKTTEKSWKVEQFRPGRQLELPRAVWQKAFRIVGTLRAD